ncbi:MAG: CPBP family intramembrane metalloprotease [Xanthomonadales bacterium]|nr:CPBP family intramembrane metalloprotease [Xanthomonadales bacterium]
MKRDLPSNLGVLWTITRMAARQARNRLRAHQVRGKSPSIVHVLAVLGACMMILTLALVICFSARIGTLAESEVHGALNVSWSLSRRVEDYRAAREELDRLAEAPTPLGDESTSAVALDEAERAVVERRAEVDKELTREASRLVRRRGGSEEQWLQRLQERLDAEPNGLLIDEMDTVSSDGLTATAFRLISLLCFSAWLALVLQGESIAFDLNRRRHPIWEWYLTFPISQPWVYLAEALRPLVSNPMLMASPLLIMAIAGYVNDSVLVAFAAIPIAVPFAVSAAIASKFIEVMVMLRVTPRNRSAWLVVAGGIGLLLLMLPLLSYSMPGMIWAVALWLVGPGSEVPSSEVLLSFPGPAAWMRAVALSLLANALICAIAFAGMHWGTRRGFEAGFGGSDQGPRWRNGSQGQSLSSRWRRWPLLHKELLWLKRDRGAIVQMLLAPLLLVGLQLMNLGNLLRNTTLDWHRLAGLIVGAGAYMIMTSAPRMLASEGPALEWMATWPKSLLEVARTKALVLAAFVTLIVLSSLVVVGILNPEQSLKIALIGICWIASGAMTAMKAVTVFPTFSPAGEVMPMQASRSLAVSAGNMIFAIAVFTGNWALAFAGLLMNCVFTAALWTEFRAHVAYLFDPDSEPVQVPPTMVSALIAIVVHLEVVAVLTAILAGFLHEPTSATAFLYASTISALAVTFFVWRWHRQRGVGLRDILMPVPMQVSTLAWAAAALILAGFLGLAARGYLWLLGQFGPAAWIDQLEANRILLAAGEGRLSLAIVTIVVAPVVEEFLFRGLLFRAMERYWSVALSALVSASFFAVVHPAISWLPVFATGLAAAWIFSRSGNLLPCVLLHAGYNTIVVFMPQ